MFSGTGNNLLYSGKNYFQMVKIKETDSTEKLTTSIQDLFQTEINLNRK